MEVVWVVAILCATCVFALACICHALTRNGTCVPRFNFHLEIELRSARPIPELVVRPARPRQGRRRRRRQSPPTEERRAEPGAELEPLNRDYADTE